MKTPLATLRFKRDTHKLRERPDQPMRRTTKLMRTTHGTLSLRHVVDLQDSNRLCAMKGDM